MTITHRPMTPDDLDMVLGWAAREGWNPGLDDAAVFHRADPEGFFLAVEDGQPVAAISVVNHTQDFAFLGLYLCQPTHRGRGIGFALWTAALDHAGSRTVGLDGVPAQQANYAKSGFAHAGGTVRYTGVLPGRAAQDLAPASPDDIPWLIEREARFSGATKHAMLTHWFQNIETRQTLILPGQGGAVTLRRCVTGYKIGPLMADSKEAAHSLLAAVAEITGAAPVSIDISRRNADLVDLCARLGLQPGFETARMYRGPAPQAAAEGLFALTTLELG